MSDICVVAGVSSPVGFTVVAPAYVASGKEGIAHCLPVDRAKYARSPHRSQTVCGCYSCCCLRRSPRDDGPRAESDMRRYTVLQSPDEGMDIPGGRPCSSGCCMRSFPKTTSGCVPAEVGLFAPVEWTIPTGSIFSPFL